jgi:hypothetical protein
VNRRRIILAGGSGFLGNALANHFTQLSDEVIVLTRRPRTRVDGVREVAWDARRLGNWEQFIDGADVVINLTGKSIQCVFTPENRRQIIASRVDSVRAISEAIRRAAQPPKLLIQASAIGYYGHTCEPAADESTLGGKTFLAEACCEWEAALNPQTLPTTRCITLRIGVVLGRDGGALPKLARLASCFLGGAAGDGQQFLSWIHLEDFIRVVNSIVENETWRGVFNATAPNPAKNAEFMRELRHVLDRPWSPPAPEFAVRLLAPLLGADASLALESQRVEPQRLLTEGFQFHFPELREALEDLLVSRAA